VWVDSSGRNVVTVGTAQLDQIDVRADRSAARYGLTSDQGLTIIACDTDKNTTGMTFIV
jgi:hypothetical protein